MSRKPQLWECVRCGCRILTPDKPAGWLRAEYDGEQNAIRYCRCADCLEPCQCLPCIRFRKEWGLNVL